MRSPRSSAGRSDDESMADAPALYKRNPQTAAARRRAEPSRAMSTAWLAPALALWFCSSVLAAERPPPPTVHVVAGGASDVFANAYIIEGGAGSVVIDALLTRARSRELRDRVDALGKPLLGVVLTHGHPDHYGGVAQLVEGRPEVPVVAVRGVDAVIRRDDAMKGERLKAFGIDWAETRTFPNVVVSDGVRLVFGDIMLTAIDIGLAESHHDSVWVLRGAGGEHAFVGDQVMSGVHAYTADAHTGRWIDSLRRLERRLASAARIYPGHGEPGGPELLKRQAAYLEEFRAQVRTLAAGGPTLSDDQTKELARRMIDFLGHNRMSRWIFEGANPVAAELADSTQR
jgi:glyoxylase-like metal-dependent hydrolase (beta-lactamase superfamily II)